MSAAPFDKQLAEQLTQQLTQILESWKLTDSEQVMLLHLPKDFKARQMYLYRRGDKVFDFTQALMQTSKMILGINASLDTTYPTHRDYAVIWLRRAVKKFKHKTPLELMLSGDSGMLRVWHFLDCTQSWQD